MNTPRAFVTVRRERAMEIQEKIESLFQANFELLLKPFSVLIGPYKWKTYFFIGLSSFKGTYEYAEGLL
jgi:hypothetical protein